MIKRILQSWITKKMFNRKAIILIGPRQVGKSTLVDSILQDYEDVLILNGDDPAIQKLMDRPNTEQLRNIIGKTKVLFIDECQRISEIGLTSKIITDHFKDVQLILSGSSSFDLQNRTSEPLTGRKWTAMMWPVSWHEWQNYAGYVKSQQDLSNRLVYGFYPDVLMNSHAASDVLVELTDSYLYKDILTFSNIRKPDEVRNLVQALAWQVGSEVSYREVSQLCGLDPKTVASYIDILEKAFVIFRLPSYSRNLRNEIKEGRKIYFYDNGIRNAAIGQLQPFDLRTDKGALWENFLMSERKKLLSYSKSSATSYFWRTTAQQEIDYVEELQGELSAFEFTFNPKRKKAIPSTFSSNYNISGTIIHSDNFRDFIMPPELTKMYEM